MVEQPRQSIELVTDDAPSLVLDFGSFFSAHHRDLALALAMTLRDDDLAADATAEAMARAFARWDEVSTYTNPSGWTYRVGLNWARSRRRKLLRELLSRDASRSPQRAAPPTPDIEPELDAALAALPVEQRSVVVLRYLLDWSEFETAEALDIPPGTVKSRLSRALEQLNRLLASPSLSSPASSLTNGDQS
ncbi:MAG: RNA polymerase sigma factor (sigma-70 family) [Candidatus Aldehydirespiratoraceae bacterium]|jgi:RNA polymerase sigma factor (sigma-70 family)